MSFATRWYPGCMLSRESKDLNGLNLRNAAGMLAMQPAEEKYLEKGK